MPEEVEVETHELQETIEELQEERRERQETERKSAWTRYIALSTAILAVFAAIGALLSGALVNEAMLDQLRASDQWNYYQAARQKEYLFTLAANSILDRGAKPPEAHSTEGGAAAGSGAAAHAASVGAGKGHAASGQGGAASPRPARAWKAKAPDARVEEYAAKTEAEAAKEDALKEKAQKLEEEANHRMHAHHNFAYCVALIQVAIALSAVSALLKMKAVWAASIVAGTAGVVFFALGFIALSGPGEVKAPAAPPAAAESRPG